MTEGKGDVESLSSGFAFANASVQMPFSELGSTGREGQVLEERP